MTSIASQLKKCKLPLLITPVVNGIHKIVLPIKVDVLLAHRTNAFDSAIISGKFFSLNNKKF
jgi:hypothetical protein